MLSSLNPVGEVARHQRWTITVGFFIVGSIAGGAVTGGILGLLGTPLTAAIGTSSALAGVAAAAGLGLAIDHAPTRLPSWRRQVDERWLTTYRGWVYGGGFGVQLGLGWATIVPRSITYVLFATMLLSGSIVGGVALGAVFGAFRAVPLLLTRRTRTPAALRRLHRRLADRSLPVDRLTRVSQLAVGAVALAGALR